MARFERLRSVLEAIALVLVIVVCVAMLGVVVPSMFGLVRGAKSDDSAGRAVPEARVPARLPKEPLSIRGAPIKGDPKARVAVVGYSDFQCPFCVRFATETLPALERTYFSKGRALLAFKHLPITSIHPQAVTLAEAAECAGRQGRFWPMHDRLFSDPKRADLGTLITHSEAVRLDLQTFKACMRGGTRGRIDADVAEATALGVTGTPTFFLGIVEPDGRVRVVERIAGARPFPVFTDAIDRLLNDAAVPKDHSERDTSGKGGQ